MGDLGTVLRALGQNPCEDDVEKIQSEIDPDSQFIISHVLIPLGILKWLIVEVEGRGAHLNIASIILKYRRLHLNLRAFLLKILHITLYH